MKIQDIAFIIIFGILAILRKERWFVYAGLVSIIAAIPLFATWIFFTAERLTWYAGAFFLAEILRMNIDRRKTL